MESIRKKEYINLQQIYMNSNYFAYDAIISFISMFSFFLESLIKSIKNIVVLIDEYNCVVPIPAIGLNLTG